jgi:hypothetical protein
MTGTETDKKTKSTKKENVVKNADAKEVKELKKEKNVKKEKEVDAVKNDVNLDDKKDGENGNIEKPRDKISEQLDKMVEKYSLLKRDLHDFHANINKLKALHVSELKRAESKKKKRKQGEHKPTGFERERPVCGELAKFIGVEDGTLLKGPVITSKVWDQFKTRGLVFTGHGKEGDADYLKQDKRVLRVTDQEAALFGVNKELVNKSTSHEDPNGLNFKTIHKYIKYASNNVTVTKDDDSEPNTKEKVKKAKVITK